MSRDHWTPLSILGGSAIIALGIYFGLRARPVVAPLAPSGSALDAGPPASASSPESGPPESGVATATNAPSPATASSASIDAEIQKATAALTKRMSGQCYAPHANEKEIPKHIHLIYSGAFDANGHEVARGFSDSREDAYPPVSKCVRELPMDLRIAAPGRNVNVVVPLELP